MPQSEWKPFHQNDNWSQRLILARECFSEIRAERTEDSPAGSPNVQGPFNTLPNDPPGSGKRVRELEAGHIEKRLTPPVAGDTPFTLPEPSMLVLTCPGGRIAL